MAPVPQARFFRALNLADLLDAAEIGSTAVAGMQREHWSQLTRVAGGRADSERSNPRACNFHAPRPGGRAAHTSIQHHQLRRNMAILATHNQTEFLEDDEFEILQGLLKLIRCQQQWANHFLHRLSLVGNRTIDVLSPRVVAGDLVESWLNDPANTIGEIGMLQCIGTGGGYAEISEREFKALRAYLSVLRGCGWLSDNIQLECEQYAEGKRRTPIQAIQFLLATEVDGFQTDTDITRRMLKDYRHLFENDPELAGVFAKPEPVQETHSAEASPKPARKHVRRARKSAA